MKGAHGESGSASSRVWGRAPSGVQEQSPWSQSSGQTFAMADPHGGRLVVCVCTAARSCVHVSLCAVGRLS